MIIGVGTHPKYRAKGLATKCLIKLCSELLRENKIPCLFYDNEEAGKIYKKLGFENIGKWGIYSK
ncbi:acetyltransferase family protein [Clostridioides difficile P2]|nr:acetyltransferase family protein [Clostridioides difficile P2]